jgi:hypothetical protein
MKSRPLIKSEVQIGEWRIILYNGTSWDMEHRCGGNLEPGTYKAIDSFCGICKEPVPEETMKKVRVILRLIKWKVG